MKETVTNALLKTLLLILWDVLTSGVSAILDFSYYFNELRSRTRKLTIDCDDLIDRLLEESGELPEKNQSAWSGSVKRLAARSMLFKPPGR